MRGFSSACLITLCAAVAPAQGRVQAPPAQIAGPTVAFVNGRWLVHGVYRQMTRWSVNGLLADRAPAHVDTTVDLGGRWVVPPFADAHTHNLDGPFNVDSVRAQYLREGTFYVQVLTNSRSGAERLGRRWNRPCELDVAYANGGITSTLSHPFLAYEPRAMGLYSDWAAHAAQIRASRRAENDAYFFVDSAADLERKWPLVLAGHPDIIKIFLLDATEHPAAIVDTGLPNGHGLRPSLVPLIVRRAHAAGIRVAAHIETANDFAIAVRAGVDMFAHLPGYEMPAGADSTLYGIDAGAARLAGARGVIATPTLSLAGVFDGAPPSGIETLRQRIQARNIRLLARNGVRIVVGSDWFGRTARGEHDALAHTGIWTPAQLLDLWSQQTAQAIFPRRRIGRLLDGWEASFLVFAEDPRQSFSLPAIQMRVKQGCILP
jgi:imidazolonepropionase-like amidohydrolase